MSNTNTCIITGANGFIGSRINRYFKEQKWNVYELRHKITDNACSNNTIPFSLKKGIIEDKRIYGANILIHCAYDFKLTRWEEIYLTNVKGSIRLFESALKSGVKNIIFISSMSAFSGCKSLYGKAKLEIEKEAFKLGITVVRPGLVYGSNPGGVFGALEKLVSITNIIPKFNKNKQILYLVHEEDLCKAIFQLSLEQPVIAEPIIIASNTGIDFYDLIKIIARKKGKHIIFIPVPWKLIWITIKISEILGLNIGFRSDSFISLLNQNTKPNFEPAKSMGIICREII